MEKRFEITLSDNWKIQSSESISEKGPVISTAMLDTDTWIPAKVPSTVLGTLVANGIYKDPYFGENLKEIPTRLFKVPWWYTTSFQLAPEQAKNFATLKFHGINYKANVWLNGRLIADTKSIDGAYRITSFNVGNYIKEGTNVLAVEVIPPKPGDFSTGFVDWNPAPPDGNMGIFRPVTLHLHSGVHIENPFVRTKIDLDTLEKADIAISAELVNASDRPLSGFLSARIADIQLQKRISIAPDSRQLIGLDSSEFPELIIKAPKLWWPVQMGEPHLYTLELEFVKDDGIMDATEIKFGIREVEDYWLNDMHRGFKINGKKVLIKGGGWTDDMLLMDTDESLEAQVKYVKQMNLNC